MKKSIKTGLLSLGLLFIVSGCAVNYCSGKDVENITKAYELKTSIYIVDQTLEIVNKDASEKISLDNKDLYTYVVREDVVKKIQEKTKNAQESSNIIRGYLTSDGIEEKASNEYYINIYEKLFDGTERVPNKKDVVEVNYSNTDFGKNYKNLKSGLDSLVVEKTLKNSSACLTINGDDKEPTSGASLEKKGWKFAWKKSPLQALITYPIAYGLDFFTNTIGASGIGQICSILLVTIIVRMIIMLCTFKSTMQQQKLTLIQPEMNAIQVKYSGKTDQVSKQKMSQEMMKVYSKYGVNPLTSMIMPFISMPVFLCVYTAVNNTAILKTGSVFGVNLGATISSSILGLEWKYKWFAILLFAIMIVLQYVTMKLPQWIQKYKDRNRRPDPRLSQTQKQTNMMTTIFFVMIIFMGWILPTAMTVYWIASSLVSLIQTGITQYVLGKKPKSELLAKKK